MWSLTFYKLSISGQFLTNLCQKFIRIAATMGYGNNMLLVFLVIYRESFFMYVAFHIEKVVYILWMWLNYRFPTSPKKKLYYGKNLENKFSTIFYEVYSDRSADNSTPHRLTPGKLIPNLERFSSPRKFHPVGQLPNSSLG